MKIKLTLFFAILHLNITAQNLSRDLVTSAGDFSKNQDTGISVSWSLGEVSTEFIGHGISIQQGFQQGELDIVVQTIQPALLASNWQAIPNPANYYLDIHTDFKQEWHYQMYNIMGQVILQDKSISGKIRVDLPALKAGLYLIAVHNGDGVRSSKKILIQQF